METIEICGNENAGPTHHVRETCRGIAMAKDQVLLTYMRKLDQWFIPGGKLEEAETLEACCIRELAEETGYRVVPLTHFLTVRETYPEWLYISHYFVCSIVGQTQAYLTPYEERMGLELCWMPLNNAMALFSHRAKHAEKEVQRGSYLRECTALASFRKNYFYTGGS